MDIRTNGAVLSLLRQLLDSRNPTEPKIAMTCGKPRFDPTLSGTPLTRKKPSEVGSSDWRIASFLGDLASEKSLDMHNILVLKDGYVIGEYGFGAYRTNVWHVTHSECKSVTALAIGFLIAEGKLSENDKIVDIFGKKIGLINTIIHKNLTVRSLLTMTSGVPFAEANSMVSDDWVRDFFASAAPFDGDGKFAYNSLNTYILSSIIKEKTGIGMLDYLKPRLFDVLGIRDVHWEKCPNGTEKGGWGLYIRPEDMAKIGQLVLNRGEWNGKQVLPRKWLEQATSAQVQTPESCGNYNYGYHIWVNRDERSFLFNGMFGQNVIGWYDTGYLLVSNAGNCETFQQSAFYSFADRYFGSRAVKDPPGANGKKLLKQTVKRISLRGRYTIFDALRTRHLCGKLGGRTFEVSSGGKAVGLLPFMTQALENSYTKGLEEVSFRYDGKLFMTVTEGNAQNTFAVGFGAPEYTTLKFPDAFQEVGVTGRLAYDEDGNPVLKIRVSFLEQANSRTVRMVFMPDGTVTSVWSEIPGKEYMAGLAGVMLASTRLSSVFLKDAGIIEYSIGQMLTPEIVFRETGGKNELR